MEIFQSVMIYIQYFLLFFWCYWLVISFWGFGKPERLNEKVPQKRFLILVPAHNEEKVIGSLVENLMNLNYPKELYDVCVIADNCNDGTAEISRNLGSLVIEHTSPPDEPKGKPYGIKYALDQYGDKLQEMYDAIAFFDADNLVSLNYLKEMNNHLVKGERLIQCYLDSKNPNDNWITLSYATSYYYMNRSWQLAKYRMGLGNAIGGTGFCVDTKLMKEVGWTARSLTEDLEFTMQCLLKGEKASWSHHARVYDEKPEGFWVSCIQRLRWARGHWDVCMKYTLPLLWRTIFKLDIKAFDGAMYLLNPGKIVLGTLTALILYGYAFVDREIFVPVVPIEMWLIIVAYNLIYIGSTLVFDASKKVNKVKAIMSLFVFNYTYVPLFVWAFFTANNKTWKRTDHSRNIAMNEIDLGTAQAAPTTEKQN